MAESGRLLLLRGCCPTNFFSSNVSYQLPWLSFLFCHDSASCFAWTLLPVMPWLCVLFCLDFASCFALTLLHVFPWICFLFSSTLLPVLPWLWGPVLPWLRPVLPWFCFLFWSRNHKGTYKPWLLGPDFASCFASTLLPVLRNHKVTYQLINYRIKDILIDKLYFQDIK